jgi:trans-aconitate methyltransferase
MATEEQTGWSGFHQAARGRPPRELLIRTLNFFGAERRAPGVAVDLGCGSGPDTLALLERGWQVHAVDEQASGLQMMRESVRAELGARLHTHACRFESFEFPSCDLIWAGFALPFCPAAAWPTLVKRVVASLNPGGRFAGDLFGDKHAWSAEEGVLTLSEQQARLALQPLDVEAFDIEDGYRVSGDEVTRWHAFAFAARKPHQTHT